VAAETFATLDGGTPTHLEITAVSLGTGTGRAALIFVDNAARDVYGERYFEAPESELEAHVRAEAGEVLDALRQEHAALVREAARRGLPAPSREEVASSLRRRVAAWVAAGELP
jgi:hypothetical protein